MNNMFNTYGQVNASSVQDALQVIAKYASAMQNMPSNTALHTQPTFTNEKRDELITRAIMTHEGKLALAQAMANPIR